MGIVIDKVKAHLVGRSKKVETKEGAANRICFSVLCVVKGAHIDKFEVNSQNEGSEDQVKLVGVSIPH